MATENISEEYDIAIIGAGISGLYTAWRLANSTNLKVLVLEATNRLGGRFMTCQMPGGFNAEMGAMRYSSICHPLLQQLITTLGIRTRPMEANDIKRTNSFNFFLRNKQIKTLEEVRKIFSITQTDLPYFLAINGRHFNAVGNEFQLQRQKDGNFAASVFKPTGQMAKDMTVSQYLLQSNNVEMFNLSWSFFPPNNFQIAVADARESFLTNHWSKVEVVDDGFQAITRAIASSVEKSGKVTVKCNEKVRTIVESDVGFTVKSMADNGKAEYICQKVIYACSEPGLRTIALEGVANRKSQIMELLNKIFLRPALKLFLTYKRAWWEDFGIYQGTIATDLPIHRVIIFGNNEKPDSFATLLATYPQAPIEYFQALDNNTYNRFVNKAGHISEKLIPSKLLVEHVHNQLKIVMGCPELQEEPVCAARCFWGTGDYGGVSYYPKVGVDSNQLHWNSLKPFKDSDIFITGDTFVAWDKRGCYLGFSEGALLTSERILVNHFGVEPLIDGLCLQNPWPDT